MFSEVAEIARVAQPFRLIVTSQTEVPTKTSDVSLIMRFDIFYCPLSIRSILFIPLNWTLKVDVSAAILRYYLRCDHQTGRRKKTDIGIRGNGGIETTTKYFIETSHLKRLIKNQTKCVWRVEENGLIAKFNIPGRSIKSSAWNALWKSVQNTSLKGATFVLYGMEWCMNHISRRTQPVGS